jgi:hypothetical protein
MRRFLVTANIVPCSPIPVILMMEALSFSETPILTRATRRNFPEDGNLIAGRVNNLGRKINVLQIIYINTSV